MQQVVLATLPSYLAITVTIASLQHVWVVGDLMVEGLIRQSEHKSCGLLTGGMVVLKHRSRSQARALFRLTCCSSTTISHRIGSND